MTEDSAASVLAAWLERIEAMHPAEIELGLERIRQVARRLGVDSMPVPVITVAGTNGKGSTLRLMQVLAERHGRRVCLYTSPHLHRFNERVCLPDGLASDQQLCEAFEQVEQARQDISLTYFEFSTLAALWLFRRSEADLVLLEVGLGGRLDAVNIVDPNVAVVTSVGLDHQDWLGDTREAIAGENAALLVPADRWFSVRQTGRTICRPWQSAMGLSRFSPGGSFASISRESRSVMVVSWAFPAG